MTAARFHLPTASYRAVSPTSSSSDEHTDTDTTRWRLSISSNPQIVLEYPGLVPASSISFETEETPTKALTTLTKSWLLVAVTSFVLLSTALAFDNPILLAYLPDLSKNALYNALYQLPNVVMGWIASVVVQALLASSSWRWGHGMCVFDIV
ncbi:hypothetical protein Rhopal_007057-T1 [Rhodotorula paludigena]|uniref:Uncharacterized protein n=1 Tax=Rhodotorula paludigena TaxID=86838 RepID=A0AAV5GXV4_9BASI|nr:hypothetical protein Rhopal_007057-T1 [Rhodotorula paludigena]